MNDVEDRQSETPLENVTNSVNSNSNNNVSSKPEVTENFHAPEIPKKSPHISLIWKILIPIFAIFIGVFAYLAITEKPIAGNGKKEENITPPVVVIPEPENPFKTFTSDQYKFSIEYNTGKHLFSQRKAFSDQPTYFQIASNENRPEKIEIDTDLEKDLEDGYLVKISVYENIDRDIEELISRKREKFAIDCPIPAEIGNVYTRNIDGNEAKTFEVKNCPQDYVINLTKFKENIIEITQIYRGDIGFKQSYRAQTETIFSGIKWIRDPQEEPTIAVYKNDEFGIEFLHPRLDTKCCSVTHPSIENLTKLVVLGDPKSKDKDGQIVNKFGVFGYQEEGKSFELFLNEQKQSLIQEYEVVEGKNPVGLEENKVLISGYEALQLKNYAWWGEVTYMKHPFRENFLIFVLPNGVTDEFRVIVENMLKDFTFTELPKKN